MDLLGKLHRSPRREATRESSNNRAAGAPARAAENVRHSNGLKDFLWLVGDVPQGRILDLGPVWQSTVTFFTERGFRVSTEDLLRSWTEFREMEERCWAAQPENGGRSPDWAAIADRFLQDNLVCPADTFHGILAWDLLDYLENELLSRVVPRLYDALRPGGVLLAALHSSKPASFHRYRILDPQAVEVLPSPVAYEIKRVFQNREVLSLFGRFRSSRTYVGRDQIREALFMK